MRGLERVQDASDTDDFAEEFRMRLEHFTSVQPVVVVQKDHRPHRDRHAFDVRIRFNRLDEISKIGGILDRLRKNELISESRAQMAVPVEEDRPVQGLAANVVAPLLLSRIVGGWQLDQEGLAALGGFREATNIAPIVKMQQAVASSLDVPLVRLAENKSVGCWIL